MSGTPQRGELPHCAYHSVASPACKDCADAPYPTTAPREGEAFTQTLQRRKAKETARVARIAAQAEKDRARRELETLSAVRRLARDWHDGSITSQRLAEEVWRVTR